MSGQDLVLYEVSKEWPLKVFQEGGDKVCFRKMKFGTMCRMNGRPKKGREMLQPLATFSPKLSSIRVGCFAHNYWWMSKVKGRS